MRILNRSVSFRFKLLGDGVYEVKVFEWVDFLGIGISKLKSKRYGSNVEVKGLVYEELDKSG